MAPRLVSPSPGRQVRKMAFRQEAHAIWRPPRLELRLPTGLWDGDPSLPRWSDMIPLVTREHPVWSHLNTIQMCSFSPTVHLMANSISQSFPESLPLTNSLEITK